MSRKAHAPTDKTRTEVSALAGFGVREDEIAVYIGIDPKTLRKHYRNELDSGHIRANAAVARALYRQAVDENNTSAAIFWLKARAGWRETTHLDHSSTDGTMSPMSLDELYARINKTADSKSGS